MTHSCNCLYGQHDPRCCLNAKYATGGIVNEPFRIDLTRPRDYLGEAYMTPGNLVVVWVNSSLGQAKFVRVDGKWRNQAVHSEVHQ